MNISNCVILLRVIKSSTSTLRMYMYIHIFNCRERFCNELFRSTMLNEFACSFCKASIYIDIYLIHTYTTTVCRYYELIVRESKVKLLVIAYMHK